MEKTVESEAKPAARPATAVPDAVRKRRNNTAVMVLLGFDVLVGAGIGAGGYIALGSETVALAGAALASIGLVLMVVFQLVGREK